VERVTCDITSFRAKSSAVMNIIPNNNVGSGVGVGHDRDAKIATSAVITVQNKFINA
jgi:hypothetical protein